MVEIIVSIVLVSIVIIFMMRLYLSVRNTYFNSQTESNYEVLVSNIISAIGDDIDAYGLVSVENDSSGKTGYDNAVVLTFNEYRETRLSEQIRKILRIYTSNGTTYISYAYDESLTSITSAERTTSVVRELPDDAVTGDITFISSSGYVEVTVPLSTSDGKVYDINVYGILESADASAGDTLDAAIEEEVTDQSYITLKALGLSANEGTPNFSSIATGNEGIYATTDNYGTTYYTTYYFRGNVKNNYVYFGGYYWRIIRINGDGTLRMILLGTSALSNGAELSVATIPVSSTVQYNTTATAKSKIGYLYGSTNSNIKTIVEGWFEDHLSNYTSYIADEIFCSDRTISSGSSSGTSATQYGAYNRLQNNKSPSLVCSSAYSYKLSVGLISADEVALAGAVYDTANSSYYLSNSRFDYWTMTPSYFNGTYAYAYYVSSSGSLSRATVTSSYYIRPVINLTTEASRKLTGMGTAKYPYILET